MALKNVTTGQIVATEIIYCDNFLTRLRGLLGRRPLTESQVCWIRPCCSVHTFGMGYDLDLYFLDKKNKVIASVLGLKPWRLGPLVWRADSVLEFASGMGARCRVGDFISAMEGERE